MIYLISKLEKRKCILNMSNIIKILRNQKGLTQDELGAYLGVKKSAIQKYESGAIVNLKSETII